MLLATALLAVACTTTAIPIGGRLAGASGSDVLQTIDPGVPYPQGCATLDLSPARCEYVVDALAARNRVDRAEVSQTLLLGEALASLAPGEIGQHPYGFVARVRFMMANGDVVEDSYLCVGIGRNYDFGCTARPDIRVSRPLEGYHDVPEGASPPPTVNPAQTAVPLSVPSLDIPLDHLGDYEVDLGSATLANGILQQGSLRLAETTLPDAALSEYGVTLRIVRPDGRDHGGIYSPGWQATPLRVRVVLVFTVLWFEPGAILRVRDVRVG